MLTVASQRHRIIVGRLERGDEVLAGLRQVCSARQVRCGILSAIGALERAVLTHYDPATRRYRPARALGGPLEVLSLQGNLSESEGALFLHAHVVLSREGDNGIEVVGGHLLEGEVFALEFTIVAMDDVLLRRAEDDETGLRLWQEAFEASSGAASYGDAPSSSLGGGARDLESPGAGFGEGEEATAGRRTPTPPAIHRSEAEPPPPKETHNAPSEGSPVASPGIPAAAEQPEARSWVEVARASEAAHAVTPARQARPPQRSGPAWAPPGAEPTSASAEAEEDDGYEVDLSLEPGDIIEHPKFGRCVVARLEGGDEYVHLRLRNRNIVRLSLDFVGLELIGAEDGHQVFRARIRR